MLKIFLSIFLLLSRLKKFFTIIKIFSEKKQNKLKIPHLSADKFSYLQPFYHQFTYAYMWKS